MVEVGGGGKNTVTVGGGTVGDGVDGDVTVGVAAGAGAIVVVATVTAGLVVGVGDVGEGNSEQPTNDAARDTRIRAINRFIDINLFERWTRVNGPKVRWD